MRAHPRRIGAVTIRQRGDRSCYPAVISAVAWISAPSAASASTRAPIADGPLVDAQVALVQVVRRAARRAGAEPAHRARDAVEVPAEVLAAQALRGRRRGPSSPEHPLDGVGRGARSRRCSLTTGGTPRLVVDLGASRRTARRSASISSRTSSSASAQATASSIRTVPATWPVAGDDVVGGAGADHAPDHADAGARVEPAGQDRGQLGDQLAEGEGEVLGQVRAGGVAAAAR